jgi:protein TonB
MGTFYDPSRFVHRLAGPAAKTPGLRCDSGPASFSNDGRKQPFLSNLEGPKEDDLIFRSLIASGDRLKLRNPRATFGSLILQLLLLMTVAVIPLFHTDPLPKRERRSMVYLQAPVETPAITPRIKSPKAAFTPAPARTAIPAPVHTTEEAPPSPVDTTSEVGAVGGFPGGAPPEMGGARSMPLPAQTPEPAPVKRIRVASGVAEANLIHDVPPQYPPEAGRGRIEGTVVLMAVIGTDGTVKDVQVESGPALLAQAAIDAVKQWRYKPYLLNGQPVEIGSRITINFTMSRG